MSDYLSTRQKNMATTTDQVFYLAMSHAKEIMMSLPVVSQSVPCSQGQKYAWIGHFLEVMLCESS